MRVKIRAIKTEEQYKNYLNQVDKLMDLDPDRDSAKGELLETLVILIKEYESRLGYELSVPNDPVYVIKNRMEELGLKQKDLIPVMGDKSTVSWIFRGERNLTYEMIGPLCDILKIPPDLLSKRDLINA